MDTEVTSVKITLTQGRSRVNRTSRLVRNLKLAEHRDENEVMLRVRNILSKEKFKDKSMLKHIIKECKVVNYSDKETSSETQISSRRRSSRTTLARLHRTCTVERRNLEEHNTADLYTKHFNGLRTQSLARRREPRILYGT